MKFDRKAFFAAVKARMGALSQSQVVGMEAILDALEYYKVTDARHMAFCFGTAEGEISSAFAPVREGFKKTDASARQYVQKLIREKGLPNYGMPDPATKHIYYGRGFVQLTWKDNYAKLSPEVGTDLVKNPDAALEPTVAARILVVGSLKGLFARGHTLSRYFSPGVTDWRGSRRIINGTDKAEKFAALHKDWHIIFTTPGVILKEKPIASKPAAPAAPTPTPVQQSQPEPTPAPTPTPAAGKADIGAKPKSGVGALIAAFAAAVAAIVAAIFTNGGN